MSTNEAAWWGVEHSCGGVERVFPTLHWADEPEVGAGLRRAFECDACGDRYLFIAEDERSAGAASLDVERLPEQLRGDGPCGDCGTLDNIVWFTENVLWNAVTGEQIVAEQPRAGILCIPCFVKRTDAAGLQPTGWRLLAEWPWRLSEGTDR